MKNWRHAIWVGLLAAGMLLSTAQPAAAEDDQAMWNHLFAPRVAQARATAQGDDDAALARELLASLGITEDRPTLYALMCQNAYELGIAAPAGYPTAVQAMEALARRDLRRRSQWLDNLLHVRRLMLDGAQGPERLEAARAMVRTCLDAAETQSELAHFAEAAAFAEQACAVAEADAPVDRARARAVQVEMSRRDRLERRLEALRAQLSDPATAAAASEELILTCVVQMDDPVEASRLLSEKSSAKLRRLVPLAAGYAKDLPAAACLELAGWYLDHASGAADEDALAMIRRARGHYRRYLALGGAPRGKLALALSQPRGLGDEAKAFAARRDAAAPDKRLEMALARLAELAGNDGVAQRLGKGATRIEGGALAALDLGRPDDVVSGGRYDASQFVASVEPLAGLPLQRLSLRGCSNLGGDLSALAGMPLRHLDLGGCTSLDSLAGIEDLPLETLVLPPSEYLLGDLSPLAKMKDLRSLTIEGPAVATLKGIEKLKLTSLTIRFSPLDSLKGVETQPLEHLALHRCFGLTSLGAVRLTSLRSLTITECPGLEAEGSK